MFNKDSTPTFLPQSRPLLDVSPAPFTPDHTTLLLCSILIALALFLIAWSLSKYRPLPYYSANWLLTRAETAFYKALRKAVPAQCHSTYKVRLGDVVRCSDRLWDKGHGKKISQQHLDFVILGREDARIWLCVELDDKSHDQPRARRRDHWKIRVLTTAGIPLMRVRVRSDYDIPTLRKQFWVCYRSRDNAYIRNRRTLLK